MQEQIFPTWRYHRTREACIVRNADELEALGEGWADTPAAFNEPEPEPELAPEEPGEAPEDAGAKQPEPTDEEKKKAARRAADKARREAAKAAKQ